MGNQSINQSHRSTFKILQPLSTAETKYALDIQDEHIRDSNLSEWLLTSYNSLHLMFSTVDKVHEV